MIEVKDVSKTYRSGRKQTIALDEINLTINRGEVFGIIGYSGAGKSTLIRCMNLLEKPTKGTISVDGIELGKLRKRGLQEQRRKIGMIFQHFHLLSSATVFDNIAFPLRLARTSRNAMKDKVHELANLVGLEEHLTKYPAQLSGGQKQRVGIARALANDPHVLLCDEATSALDPQTTDSILALLLDINRKLGLTIVLITHEMHVIQKICDRVAVMENGRIVESGNVLDVFLHPQHAVTKQFVSQVQDEEEIQPYIREAQHGSLLRITFRGEQTYEPVLFEVIKETGLSLSILQGSISRMKETPYGQLLVELKGSSEAADAAVRALRQHGLNVEVV